MTSSEINHRPTRLTLISHGSTPAVRRGAFPWDEDLAVGESDKIAALQWIAPRAQQVWCGPENRTRQTAKALGLEPVLKKELGDVNYGRWRGKGLDELQNEDPAGLMQWLVDPSATPHGGESQAALIARVADWIATLSSPGHVLAVTHPSVIRAAILHVLQGPLTSFWKIEIAPLSVTDLRFNGRHWIVRSAGSVL